MSRSRAGGAAGGRKRVKARATPARRKPQGAATGKKASAADVDALLDETVAKLGTIIGDLGYSAPPPGPFALSVPSGWLAVCDLSALPSLRSRGAIRRRDAKGRRVAHGHVLPVAKAQLSLLVLASLGDVDQWAVTPDIGGKAVRGKALARLHPRSGVLAVGDLAAVAALAQPGPPVVHARKPAWPVERFLGHLAEVKVSLPPRAQVLAELSAATGLCHVPVDGLDVAILHVGHKAPLWLRKGIAVDGSQASLYMDAALDGVMADPVLRRIVVRDRARARRRKASDADAAEV